MKAEFCKPYTKWTNKKVEIRAFVGHVHVLNFVSEKDIILLLFWSTAKIIQSGFESAYTDWIRKLGAGG